MRKNPLTQNNEGGVIIAPGAIIDKRVDMRIFKTKLFSKWARKEKLGDKQLIQAIQEMERGLVDGDLGGHVYKKRIALGGQGKRGSLRTILAFKVKRFLFLALLFHNYFMGHFSHGSILPSSLAGWLMLSCCCLPSQSYRDLLKTLK